MAYTPNGFLIMPTRNVVLTEQQEDMFRRLVASGRYQNASEVLREGLHLVEAREAEEAARLNALREAASIGIADIEAGRVRTFRSHSAMERHLDGLTDETIRRAKSRKRRA